MKDVQFMTGKEKELVLKQWERFLKNGLKWDDFTDRLYKHLTLHCSFIAHYSRSGFYSTYFEDGDDTAHFLSQFDTHNAEPGGVPKSIEYGMTYWATDERYEDINKAMIEVAGKYITNLVASAKQSQKNYDIATARQLLTKHGMKLKI